MRFAAGRVRLRLEEREQAHVVERAKPQLGIERGRGVRQRRARQRRITGSECRGPRVVPGRVVVLMRLELREIGGCGRAHVALVPRLLGRRARPLRLRRGGSRETEQDADERRGATSERLRRQHEPREQQRNPGAGPSPLRAALRRHRALVRRHEIADRAGLVGQLRRDNRPLRGVGDGTEHLFTAAGQDRSARRILLPGHQRAAIVAHRNLGGLASSLRHQDEVNAESRQATCFLQRLLEGVVGFAVGEHDEHAIGDLRAGMQQVDSLRQRGRQRRPAFRRNVRIERVEIQGESRTIHR